VAQCHDDSSTAQAADAPRATVLRGADHTLRGAVAGRTQKLDTRAGAGHAGIPGDAARWAGPAALVDVTEQASGTLSTVFAATGPNLMRGMSVTPGVPFTEEVAMSAIRPPSSSVHPLLRCSTRAARMPSACWRSVLPPLAATPQQP
jgi:hypothetical protein